MKMTVIGCGHLGATHAACMASIGHEVIGIDIDESKVGLLDSGRSGSMNRNSMRCWKRTSRPGAYGSQQISPTADILPTYTSLGWPLRAQRRIIRFVAVAHSSVHAYPAFAGESPSHREEYGRARYRRQSSIHD